MKTNTILKTLVATATALTLTLGITGGTTTMANTTKTFTRTTNTPTVTSTMTVNPNANEQAVFYIPHQDDEALTFGVSILNHIDLGFDVHVVMLTDGGASVIKDRLGMTRSQFTQARNNEFMAAMRLMGVKESNVRFANFRDNELTVEQVASVVREYDAKYPTARHKTYSYGDWHTDHKNAGLGLKKVVDEGLLTDARYYVRREETASPNGTNLVKDTFKPYYGTVLKAVADAYTMENPRLGLYGIGYKSVPSSFDWLITDPSTRYHK